MQSFFESLRLDDDVVSVKYFTAVVDPDDEMSATRQRQLRYFAALRTLPKVRIIYGKYQKRTVSCRGLCREKYKTPDEKKTDVNIAVNLLDDAMKGAVDSIVLVSGDSDQEPAVAWVRNNHPEIKITVYIPVRPDEAEKRRNDFYNGIKVVCKPLPIEGLAKHQLPNQIPHPHGGIIERPTQWSGSATKVYVSS